MEAKNVKILIADDSVFMRNVLKKILQSGGYSQFIECSNGQECLERFKADQPDVILLDIIMPEVDGLAVLKQIGNEARVLVISAIGQDMMIEDAKRYGAKGYIVKPFEQDNVLKEVGRVIQ